ncbi:LytR/AlgR family response regulator transcription factor [Pedobacter sp.]
MTETNIKPITALIVDDERDSRRLLSLYLREDENIIVAGEACSVRDAYEQILRLRPDLVFLDIHMPSGDGFSLLKMFASIKFEVIFVTSFDQYAIQAIRNNALDYLLKPIVKTELQQATAKALERIRHNRSTASSVSTMMTEREQQYRHGSKLTVHRGDHVHLIDVEDIMYITSSDRYVKLKLWDGSEHFLTKTLKTLQEELSRFPMFLRTSKTEVINVEAVIQYGKGFTCMITMADHKVFEVSRRKKTEVLSKLASLKI